MTDNSSMGGSGKKKKALVLTRNKSGDRSNASARLLSTISELTAVPVKASSLDEASRQVLSTLAGGLENLHGCSLLLYDPKGDSLRLIAAKGITDPLGPSNGNFNRNLSFKPGEGVAGRVYADRKPLFWSPDISDPGLLKVADHLTTPQSLACLPLNVLGRTIGVINLSFNSTHPFDRTRQLDLVLLSNVVGNTIQSFLLMEELGEKAQSLTMTVDECKREIQERKQAEKQLKEMQEQLTQAQKMEAVGTLAGGVAHDFNNILQGISGYTQLLLNKTVKNHPYQKYLIEIDRSVLKASELVKELLAFGRKMKIETRPLDIGSEIERVCRILRRTVPPRIEIQVTLADKLWPVLADPAQLERLLMNLGLNAMDAITGNGRIRYRAENLTISPNQWYQEKTEPGQYVLIRVADTGHGIPREQISQVFDPFFTTKGVGKGTGLGLSTAYGIVRGHGGTIHCESHPESGTTFEILFPASPDRIPAKSTPQKRFLPITGSETILLVDDDEAIIDSAREFLEESGYHILRAESGERAINIYGRDMESINLIVLDLGMPGMGGHRCLEQLLEMNPKAKILISSGYSPDGPVRRALESGAVDYISKPFRLTAMVSKIRTILDQ